jgi:hypothetical protein
VFVKIYWKGIRNNKTAFVAVLSFLFHTSYSEFQAMNLAQNICIWAPIKEFSALYDKLAI